MLEKRRGNKEREINEKRENGSTEQKKKEKDT